MRGPADFAAAGLGLGNLDGPAVKLAADGHSELVLEVVFQRLLDLGKQADKVILAALGGFQVVELAE